MKRLLTSIVVATLLDLIFVACNAVTGPRTVGTVGDSCGDSWGQPLNIKYSTNMRIEEDLLHFREVCGCGTTPKKPQTGGRTEAYLSFTTVLWLSLILIFSS